MNSLGNDVSEALNGKIEVLMGLTLDILDFMDADDLPRECGIGFEDSFGKNFWCLIGARESFSKAINAGEWQGFECPITKETAYKDKTTLKDYLISTQNLVLETVSGLDWSRSDIKECLSLILRVIEHEVAHHGHMIRYAQHLDIELPKTVQDKYHLNYGK